MRRFLSIVLALGLVLSFSLVTAVPVLAFTEVWVDDDFTPSTPGWGTDAFDNIQEAVDYIFFTLADDGIAHVAAGDYYENIDLRNGVDVLGAGANVTTIYDVGDSGPVVSANGIDSGTKFDGFTVTGGVASVGGGIYNNDSSPTVSNCIITGNEAANFGGGMYNINGSSPVVASCIFEGNTATVFGGGICCWDSISSTIINNTIVNNTANINGGGIYANPGSSPSIINNIIVGNTAANGGGIYVDTGATPTIEYNDVWNNSGGNYGGIATAGPGDISIDPNFDDPEYHIIYPDSPCIDVGDNDAVTAAGLTTDFEGEPRVFDGNDDGTDTVDMGADEYYVPPPPPPPSRTVGGEVYPVDKAALLLPWLGLGLVLILAAGGLILVRRRSR